MKRILYLIFLLAAFVTAGNAGHAQEKSIRMMSYNIRNGKGMDGIRNLDRVAATIERYMPDVVALQEVDSMTTRSGKQDVAAILGSKCRMKHFYSKAIDFDGGGYGIAVLCRRRPIAIERIPLPSREEKRTLLIVEFRDFVFADMHLSLTEADRDASLPVILKALERYGQNKPVFIAGDWNTEPNSRYIAELLKHFDIISDTTVDTFPADNPTVTIDYIAVDLNSRAAIECDASVINEPLASDHRPVLVNVTFTKYKKVE